VQYRKFDTAYLNYVLGTDYTNGRSLTVTNDLPITTIASDKITFPIETSRPSTLNAQPSTIHQSSTIPEWQRWNDYGIGLLLEGDRVAWKGRTAEVDFVGGEDLAKRVEEGFTDFDVAIATPDMMPVVGKLGRILGPQGKMPNPKVGTVTMDVRKAVEESKAGKVEYRTDRTAIVHMVIGKHSFDERRLLENYAAVIDELVRAKPAAAKGRYLRSITLATTMGPGVKVDPGRTRDILEEALPATAAPPTVRSGKPFPPSPRRQARQAARPHHL